MSRDLPKPIPVKEVAQKLNVKPALIYHWIDHDLLTKVEVKNPYLNIPSLVPNNYFEYVDKYGRSWYGRKRVKAVIQNELEWLLFVKDKMPDLVNYQNTSVLKIIKKHTFPLTKESSHYGD